MGAEVEFNSLQFEKKLSGLKDSQDSINAACLWCLDHKQFHKNIVATWLSVLKRVKVEQRLTLFYLANDVIQYSKRKNFDFVESWGTALQKATTLVRDARVKNKILRIFKIWEQRGVYGEEFISDLSGLISVSPSSKKTDDCNEFQSSHLVSKIRTCAKLESETDRKLQVFKQHNPKMQDGEALMASLKDRAHVDDVEKEMDEYISHMESYIEALKMEIKARNSLINLLTNTDTQLEKDRKDVKVVAVAYKSFATRVKNLRKKLEEKKTTLNSPVPSPDINAPSPSPDSDLELPENRSAAAMPQIESYPTAGFYNQTAMNTTDGSGFANNGFSSFIGSGMTFSLDTNNKSNSLTNLFPGIADPPPPPAPVPVPAPANSNYNNSYSNNQMPLAPPPLPPFTNEGYCDYGGGTYNGGYNDQLSDPYYNNSNYPQSGTGTDYNAPVTGQSAYGYKGDEYNPEEEVETWEGQDWEQPPSAIETPASPPPVEKESFLAPIEYHESQTIPGAVDVDHRILLGINNNSDKKDIDHRNLISLTGSPKETDNNTRKERPVNDWHSDSHAFRRNKEFRRSHSGGHASHNSDNNESIDMELSDDETAPAATSPRGEYPKPQKKGLLPPPPFPADLENHPFMDGLSEMAYDAEESPLAGGNQFDKPWRRISTDDKWTGPPLQMGASGNAPPSSRHSRHGDVEQAARMRRGGVRAAHANGGRGEFSNRGEYRDSSREVGTRGRYRGKFPRSSWGGSGRTIRGGRHFGGGSFHKNY